MDTGLKLPSMMKQKWGRIINISGVDPFLGGSVTKGMAKLGIIGFTRGMASEDAGYVTGQAYLMNGGLYFQ